MPEKGSILSIFGIDGVLRLRENPSQVNSEVRILFEGQLRDPEFIIGVISDLPIAQHSDMWQWMLHNFSIAKANKPIYLFLKRDADNARTSASRHLAYLLGRRPRPVRVYCIDQDIGILSAYRNVIKQNGIYFWRTQTLDSNGNISTVETSFSDRA